MAEKGLSVSALDLVAMKTGETAGSAIARSVELAQHVERLGYRRFWLAEHHSISGLACSATSVLIGHVAGATKTIRVGSGGVMLPNHAPLVVAEQFGTLAALYPDRIDLGLGRAPGGDQPTMRALRRGLTQSGDDFPELLTELQGYLGPERPGQGVKAFPGQNSNVPITLLGSSGFSAILAAQVGLRFCFRSALCAGIYVCGFAGLPGAISAERRTEQAVFDDCGAGDCGGDRCRGAAVVYDSATAVFEADPESAGRAIAASRFDGRALAALGKGSCDQQDGRGDCWL